MHRIFPAIGEEHIEANCREDEQHAYRRHDEVEMRQMLGRLSLDEVITFHIGCSQQRHKQRQTKDFNLQSSMINLPLLVDFNAKRHHVFLYFYKSTENGQLLSIVLYDAFLQR